ncbi:MAG: PAS domain S-box protein, partial [Anaerolineales bacterium]
ITERKQMEATLRESEERFRKIFHSSPVAICITTLEEGRLLDANSAYWNITGYKPEVSIGRNAEELKMWDSLQERAEFVKDLKLKNSLFNPDDHFYHTDGSLKQVISFYELIQIGEQQCILSMFYDMSVQKHTLQALQKSEARIRALLEAMPDMIFELSIDGIFVDFIPSPDSRSLLPPQDFLGRNIREIMPPEVASSALFAIRRAQETGQLHAFGYQLPVEGEMRSYEARVMALPGKNVITIVREVTLQKQLEKDREDLINELETKNAESETLRESLASIVGTFEFTEIIDRILGQIKRVVPYDTASVWRVDGKQQIFIAGMDLPSELHIPGTILTVNENNSAYSLIMGELPYILNNNVQEELSDFQNPVDSYVKSWLAVPLKTRGKIIGLISLDGRQKDQFNGHHAEMAVTFANQVAIALENASLFYELHVELEARKDLIAELEAKNAEAETLRESVAIVAATLEKTEAVDRILEQLERVVPYNSASVQLLHGDYLEIVGGRGLSHDVTHTGMKFKIDNREPSYSVLQ